MSNCHCGRAVWTRLRKKILVESYGGYRAHTSPEFILKSTDFWWEKQSKLNLPWYLGRASEVGGRGTKEWGKEKTG